MSDSALKPVDEQVLRQSEIIAMKTLSAHIEQLGEQIGTLVKDMKEVRDKVITLEAVRFDAQISKLESEVQNKITALENRVSGLEMSGAASRGAKTFATEVRDWAPTIVALAGLAVFYFTQAG